jgi:hypothetical protein
VQTKSLVLAFASIAALVGTCAVSATTCPNTAFCLSDTVTYSTQNGVVINSTGNPVNGPITVVAPDVSYTLGDAFGPGQALSPTTAFPTSATNPSPGGNTQYNFYDDFLFTTTSSSTDDAAVISSFSTNNGISNLQARIFSSTGNPVATLGTPVGGAVDGWTAASGPTGSLSILLPTGFPGGSYDLQIRGTVNGGAGAYGGNIDFAPVPLPAALPLLLSGLGGFGALLRRRKLTRA